MRPLGLLLLLFALSAFCEYENNFALLFDGANDFVLINHEESDASLAKQWTVEAWIKAEENQIYSDGPYQANIIGFPFRHPSLEMCINGTTLCEEGQMITQLRSENGEYFSLFGDTTNIFDEQWHHVAASWNNVTLKLFVDGEQVGSQYPYLSGYRTPKLDNSDSKLGLQIGGFFLDADSNDQGMAQQYFHGTIDEVRVWNKGRTAEEIRRTMHSTIPEALDGLKYYWRFDESSGRECKSLVSQAAGSLGGGRDQMAPNWVVSTAPIDHYPNEDHFTSTESEQPTPLSMPGVIAVTVFLCVACLTVGFVAGAFVMKKLITGVRHKARWSEDARGSEMASLVDEEGVGGEGMSDEDL